MLTERNVKGDYILSSSSKDAEEFDPGDLIVSSVGAGGGYGEVLDRDPELVLQDLEDGLITKDIAEGIYCVVIDPDTKLVDEAATKVRKDSVRQERLKNGQTFDKFIVDWMKQKPDEHILEHYGNWPEPHLPQYNKPFWGFYD